MPARTRPVVPEDAPEIARLQTENRAFLTPWDAMRPDAFYTATGQAVEVQRMVERAADGRGVGHVILDEDGRIAGLVRLNDIVRGASDSCSLGYWVDRAANGRGLGSEAVASMLVVAFGVLGLHRVEAATLRHNGRSQRVLAKNGFQRIGMAPEYLRIAGEWQDHDLFQRLADPQKYPRGV